MRKYFMYTSLTLMMVCVILSTVGCKSGKTSILNQEENLGNNIDNVINISNLSGESGILSGDLNSNDLNSGDELEIKKEQFDIDEQCIYNESGRIIIVMYHRFAQVESDEWTRSYDNFYGDLKYLYEHGYRSVSLSDYVNNTMKVPVGCTPIIFTFDDGSKGQFNLIKNDSGDLVANPNSAVGIMEKFYSEYPDFGLNGTFFVNATGFFQGEGTNAERLNYLINKGFEIGNHTSTHVDFSKASIETIKKEVGTVSNLVSDLTNGYNIFALALPFGISSKEYKSYIASGDYNGRIYDNQVILLVGAAPVYSVNNEKTNLLALPRVRARGGNKAVECDLYYWLDVMEKNPEKKYTRIS